MVDVLVGAAERAATVSLLVAGGGTHRVRIAAVGHDVVVATTDSGGTLLFGPAAIRGVMAPGDARSGAASRPTTGTERDGYDAVRGEFHMRDIPADWVERRPRISIGRGDDRVTGTLIGVGVDAVVITTAGVGDTAYVRLDSTTEMSLSLSSST